MFDSLHIDARRLGGPAGRGHHDSHQQGNGAADQVWTSAKSSASLHDARRSNNPLYCIT